MDKSFSVHFTGDTTLTIEQVHIVSNYNYIQIGSDLANKIVFVVEDNDLFTVFQQWQNEIGAALHEAYLRNVKKATNLEAAAHFADGTLDDLVHGANAGGQQ
jgi:hypothetical protein